MQELIKRTIQAALLDRIETFEMVRDEAQSIEVVDAAKDQLWALHQSLSWINRQKVTEQ